MLHKNSDLFTQINSISELKLPSKVKPKRQPPDARNKKRFKAHIGLDKFICCKLSRFKYEEAQINYCIRIIDKHSDIVEVSKKKKIKQIKTLGGKKKLKSGNYNNNCNYKKQNKKVVKKL